MAPDFYFDNKTYADKKIKPGTKKKSNSIGCNSNMKSQEKPTCHSLSPCICNVCLNFTGQITHSSKKVFPKKQLTASCSDILDPNEKSKKKKSLIKTFIRRFFCKSSEVRMPVENTKEYYSSDFSNETCSNREEMSSKSDASSPSESKYMASESEQSSDSRTVDNVDRFSSFRPSTTVQMKNQRSSIELMTSDGSLKLFSRSSLRLLDKTGINDDRRIAAHLGYNFVDKQISKSSYSVVDEKSRYGLRDSKNYISTKVEDSTCVLKRSNGNSTAPFTHTKTDLLHSNDRSSGFHSEMSLANQLTHTPSVNNYPENVYRVNKTFKPEFHPRSKSESTATFYDKFQCLLEPERHSVPDASRYQYIDPNLNRYFQIQNGYQKNSKSSSLEYVSSDGSLRQFSKNNLKLLDKTAITSKERVAVYLSNKVSNKGNKNFNSRTFNTTSSDSDDVFLSDKQISSTSSIDSKKLSKLSMETQLNKNLDKNSSEEFTDSDSCSIKDIHGFKAAQIIQTKTALSSINPAKLHKKNAHLKLNEIHGLPNTNRISSNNTCYKIDGVRTLGSSKSKPSKTITSLSNMKNSHSQPNIGDKYKVPESQTFFKDSATQTESIADSISIGNEHAVFEYQSNKPFKKIDPSAIYSSFKTCCCNQKMHTISESNYSKFGRNYESNSHGVHESRISVKDRRHKPTSFNFGIPPLQRKYFSNDKFRNDCLKNPHQQRLTLYKFIDGPLADPNIPPHTVRRLSPTGCE